MTNLAISIDPIGTTDIDDALWTNGDDLLVYIPCADKIIEKQSLLDLETKERKETLYKKDSRRPMLNEQTEQKLSLSGQKQAIKITITVKPDGQFKLKDVAISEVFVVNLSYEEADELETLSKKTVEREQLKNLRRLTQLIMEYRLTQGAIAGVMSKDGFFIDEDGNKNENHISSKMLVAQAMIAANHCLSKYLGDKGIPLLYRVHQYDSQKLEKKDFYQYVKEYADISYIERFKKQAMSKAFYSPKNVGHISLALESYGHFTSPIRRYADLVNNRILVSAIIKNRHPYTLEELIEIGHYLSPSLEKKKKLQAPKSVLKNIPVSLLPRAIKIAFESKKMDQLLVDAIIQNINLLSSIDIYRAMFHPDSPHDFKKFLLSTVNKDSTNPAFSLSHILNIYSQSINSNLSWVEKPLNAEGFIVFLLINNKFCKNYGFSTTKKEAKQLASFYYLESILLDPTQLQDECEINDALIVATKELLFIDNEKNKPTDLDKNIDYVSKLNLICQQGELSVFPEYNFEETKDKNFKCIAFWGEYEVTGQSSSKKKAKQLAAKQLIEILEAID